MPEPTPTVGGTGTAIPSRLIGASGLPEGELEYVLPVSHNNKIGTEEWAERRQINHLAHMVEQRRGTSFHAEWEQLRTERWRKADEAEDRYSTASPASLAALFANSAG